MRNRASILVGLLWILALLSLVVVGALHTARMDLLTGKNFGDKIQARYLALAGIEKAEALLYQNAQERGHGGKNHTGELYNDAGKFRDVEFGRGTYSVLRRARPDEGGGVIYGISDEESRLNANTADEDALAKLTGMTPDLATAILRWHGQGGGVAETDYYLSQRPPYKPRGAAFQTLREMLMVRGVAPDSLLGRDVHLNGLLEEIGDSSGGPPKYQDTVSAEDLGWAGILTVDSAVKNVNATGDARVNIQTADESALSAVHGITPQIARAVVSYRGQNRFQDIADLLDVTPPQNNGNSRNGNTGAARNNSSSGDSGGSHVISESLLMDIADDVTASTDDNLSGAININTAGADVLICLPGIERNLAQAIISYRQSSGFLTTLPGC